MYQTYPLKVAQIKPCPFLNTSLAHELNLEPTYLGNLTILSEEGLKTYGEGEELGQMQKKSPKKEFLNWLKESILQKC